MMETRNYHSLKPITRLLGSIIVLLLILSVSPTHAQDDQDKYEKYDIVVEVNGMFCPFCSYSIEKNLNKMKEVKQADVSLMDGVAKLILEQEQKVTKKQVTKVVTNAGYKTGKFLKFPGKPVAETSKPPE